MNVLVCVDKSHQDKLKSVTRKLESAGMTIVDVFQISGTIAGEVASDDFSKLRNVEGVASVEEDQIFHTY